MGVLKLEPNISRQYLVHMLIPLVRAVAQMSGEHEDSDLFKLGQLSQEVMEIIEKRCGADAYLAAHQEVLMKIKEKKKERKRKLKLKRLLDPEKHAQEKREKNKRKRLSRKRQIQKWQA